MTAAEWERTDDAREMLAALGESVSVTEVWHLVAILGRAFCERVHYTMAMATETAERMAAGCGDDRALNSCWFNAFGRGMYPEDAREAADDMLDAAAQHLPASELAALVRRALGNPLLNGSAARE